MKVLFERSDNVEGNRRRLLGARIVFYRKLKCVNQKDLATKIGVSRQYLSRLEHGKCSCSIENMYRIADELGIEASKLSGLGKEDGEKPIEVP